MKLLPEEHMKRACEQIAIATPQIIATDGFRWTLDDYEGLGPNLIKLERLLQLFTGRPIDLRVEPISDKNKRKQRNVLESKQPGS